jgi:heat shock protein HtpX
MNFLEQQSKNRQRTFWLVVVFSLLLGVLGFGLDVIAFSPRFFETGVWTGTFPVFTFVAVIISIAQSWSGYYYGDKIILRSTQARKADENVAPERQLINVVNEISLAAGIPCPAIYVIPDSDPNAFATGRNPEHASLAVTQGLLDKLNREELAGVVAHELGHIRNHDTQLLMLLGILLGTVLIFHQIAVRGRISKLRSGKKGGGILILIWIIAALLAPFFARLLSMGRFPAARIPGRRYQRRIDAQSRWAHRRPAKDFRCRRTDAIH